MPYVMIPAFHPNAQPMPVTSEAQMGLPLQPIPCKPGELHQTLGNVLNSPAFARWSELFTHPDIGMKDYWHIEQQLAFTKFRWIIQHLSKISE